MILTQWNPDTDDVVGLQWRGAKHGGSPLVSPSQARIQRFRSTTAETIRDLYAYLDGFNYGLLGAEVFVVGSEVPTGFQENYFYPTGSPASLQVNNAAGTAVNLYQSVDETGAVNYADYNQYNTGVLDAICDYTFTVGATLNGRRILALLVELDAQSFYGGGKVSASIVDSAGTPITLGDIGVAWPYGRGPLPPVSTPWAQQFALIFWTPAVLTALNGTAYRLRLTVSGPPIMVRIYRLRLRVVSVVENRVAAGLVAQAGGFTAPGWLRMGLSNPDMLNNWAKAANTDYTFLIRPVPGPNIITDAVLGRLDGERLTSGTVAGPGAGDMAMEVNGHPASPILNLDPSQYHPIAPRIAATGNASVDSMPYTAPFNIDGATGAAERITITNSKTFDQLQIVCSAENDPAEPILYAVTRVSTGAVVSTGLIPVEAFTDPATSRDLGNGYREITWPLATSFTTVAANQYAVAFIGFDPAGEGWLFAALVDYGGVTGGGATNFGGTTDNVYVGAVPSTTGDLMACLLTPTAAPTALEVEAAEQALPNLACGIDGVPATIPFARLTWTEPSLGVDFAGVEVARYDPFHDRWDLIGRTLTAGLGQFDDHEAHVGIEQRWRVRMVRLDGSRSPWSTEAVETLDGGPLVQMTSNVLPYLNCAYDDSDRSGRQQPRDYTFLDGNRVTFTALHGEDYQKVERPTETLGDRWSRTLLVQRQPGYVGVNRFDDLKAISRAAIPYVCVRERGGGKWYAAVQVLTGSIRLVQRGRDAVALCDVTVTEIAGRPEMVDRS